MLSPFKFGKIVEGKYFTNREDEISKLTSNFINSVNTVIISPRRWGKSSLVKAVINNISEKSNKLIICEIDLLNVRNEMQFYSYYTKQIIKSTYTKTQELINAVKLFFKKVSPRIALPVNHINNFEITFEYKDIKDDYEDILSLPDKIAEKKGIKIIVCIDEFQNISFFNEPELFQSRLRSSWQKHKNAAYCIYGSKTHMMETLFYNKSAPFYKFGDLMYLQKISKDKLINFIVKGFRMSKKFIDKTLAEQIVDSMECQPYYVQQLAHLTWIRTNTKANNDTLKEATDDLLTQNSPQFINEVDSLSNPQIKFLEALTDSKQDNIYSAEVISKYNIGSTAHLSKIIKTLIKKEIIHKVESKYEFIDPAFKAWFRLFYLKKSEI